MSEYISVINNTLELSEVRDRWIFDGKYQCWCLQDVLYTLKAATPKFQRLSIFVPASYMEEGGVINPEGSMNGFTAVTAPVIMNNNSAGYMEMPHVRLGDPRCFGPQYLERGFIYVTCGNRGRESKDADGKRCGKIPSNLIDLKTVIRFLRHNADVLPGDMEKIISIGWSAGGAMSALLGVTGNNKNYNSYLEESGAFMDERDDVYASQIYCPIIDLEHADMAYEWMFRADKENGTSPAGPAGTMTPFGEALSQKLSESYIRYFNGLGLKHPETGEALALDADGRSGSAYDYLMTEISKAATKFLTKLDAGKLQESCSSEDYIKGNYTGETTAPQNGDKSGWLSWDGRQASVSDLDTYVLNHCRRLKPCTAFDSLSCKSAENEVYGTPEQAFVHFSTEVAGAISSLKEQFPEEYAKYDPVYVPVTGDKSLACQKFLNNPLNFISTDEKSDHAKYYRVRVGACDADTSFMIGITLALKLANAGKPVDYALVWDKPHCEADYPGELCDWIERICR